MTRVVRTDELGSGPDKSLREQMRKLELSPQEGEDTLTYRLLILKVLFYIIPFIAPSQGLEEDIRTRTLPLMVQLLLLSPHHPHSQ